MDGVRTLRPSSVVFASISDFAMGAGGAGASFFWQPEAKGGRQQQNGKNGWTVSKWSVHVSSVL